MLLGVLGGCGPAAGMWFCQRVTDLTDATCDEEHVDMLLYSRASIPDRSAYLLGQSTQDPYPALLDGVRTLVAGGADLLAIICHTAHVWLPALQAEAHAPLLDMPALACRHARLHGYTQVGILGTLGTRAVRLYDAPAVQNGLSVHYPSHRMQEQVHRAIYAVKAGRPDAALPVLRDAAADMAAVGCQAVFLACTELSLAILPRGRCGQGAGVPLPLPFLDPLEILARRAIFQCGKKVKEAHACAALFTALDSVGRPLATAGAGG